MTSRDAPFRPLRSWIPAFAGVTKTVGAIFNAHQPPEAISRRRMIG
jgi:hypothetical protein